MVLTAVAAAVAFYVLRALGRWSDSRNGPAQPSQAQVVGQSAAQRGDAGYADDSAQAAEAVEPSEADRQQAREVHPHRLLIALS